MQQPAALDLRVNTLFATRDEVLQALQTECMEAQATPYSPIGIRLKDKPALTRHPLFLSGKIEIQDEGSQLLGYLLAPRRNEMVVDFCAGAGGKTLMLGAMMNSSGRLYAFDISEKRLANLKPRLKRSGLSNLHPQLIAHENDSKVKRLAGKIDRVLVDSPCSGLGTLRRSPDLKFRQSPQSLIELKHQQTAKRLPPANCSNSAVGWCMPLAVSCPKKTARLLIHFLPRTQTSYCVPPEKFSRNKKSRWKQASACNSCRNCTAPMLFLRQCWNDIRRRYVLPHPLF